MLESILWAMPFAWFFVLVCVVYDPMWKMRKKPFFANEEGWAFGAVGRFPLKYTQEHWK